MVASFSGVEQCVFERLPGPKEPTLDGPLADAGGPGELGERSAPKVVPDDELLMIGGQPGHRQQYLIVSLPALEHVLRDALRSYGEANTPIYRNVAEPVSPALN